MATTGRQRDPSVVESLFDKPFAFDFYQAVRLLAWLHRNAPKGERATEPVRFGARLSLDTPASEIYELLSAEPAKEDRPSVAPRMTVNFLGLTGPSGVLPRFYTELLLERRYRFRDRTLERFLDIFNHRVVRQFYEAWSKYHVFVDFERQTREGFTRYLLDLIGLGTDGLRDRLSRNNLGMPDTVLAYYAGILSQSPRSAAGLEAIVTDYFGVSARVQQFFGRWQRVPQDQCTALGESNSDLGDSAMLGSTFWDQESKFRLRVGPLSHKQFRALLPNAAGFVALARFGNFYAGPSLDFDVQLVIRRAEVPYCVLGGKGEQAAYLGWSTWLTSRVPDRDPDDATFTVGKARRWRPTETRVYGESVAVELARHWRPPEAEEIVH